MKPSVALNKGKTMIRHGRGDFFVQNNDETLCACPAGMMLLAVGFEVSGGNKARLYAINVNASLTVYDRFPKLEEKIAPTCTCLTGYPLISRLSFIAHMNDQHEWTVDQVQAWLEEQGL